jgi:hypothetical protein
MTQLIKHYREKIYYIEGFGGLSTFEKLIFVGMENLFKNEL